MGILDSFNKALTWKEEDEEQNNIPAAGGVLGAFNAALGQNNEQTPEPASASDYSSLALPTPKTFTKQPKTPQPTAGSLALPTPTYTPLVQRMAEENAAIDRERAKHEAVGLPAPGVRKMTPGAAGSGGRGGTTLREKKEELDTLRAERNEGSAAYASGDPAEAMAQWERQKATDQRIAELEKELTEKGVDAKDYNGPQTVFENFGAGALSAVRGAANALTYAGQEMTRGQLMEQQSVMSGLPGQQEIADSSGKTLEDMKERGLQSFEQTAETLGAKGLAKLDRGIQSFAQTAAEHAGKAGKVTRAMANVANGVGGMVPSIISNLVVPGSGLWVMAAQAAGNATEEALNAGAQDEKAVLYGGAVAAVEVLTEKMFGGIPGLNIGSLDEGIENLVKKNLGSEAAQRAVLFLADALGEGAEEFISEFADWGLNKWLVGSDGRTLREVNKDAWYSALIGSLTSVAMSAPAEAVKRMGPKRLAQEVAEKMDRRLAVEQRAEELKLPDPAKVAAKDMDAKIAWTENALHVSKRADGYYFERDGVWDGPFASEKQARNWASFELPDVRSKNANPDKTTEDLALSTPGESGKVIQGKIIPEQTQQASKTSQMEEDAKTVTQKLADSVPDLKDMKPVAMITGKEVPKVGRASDRALAFLKTIGMKVFREGFGDVLFSRNNVKGGLIGHGISDAKVDMMAAVPGVIEKGRQIDFHPRWKGRPWDAYVFAGPVQYGNLMTYLAAVVAKDNNSNRYYLHQVVDESGNVVYDRGEDTENSAGKNKEAADAAVDGRPVLPDGLSTVSSPEASNPTVTQPKQEVKTGLELPEVPAQQQPVTQAPAPLPTPEEWKNRDQAPKPAAEQKTVPQRPTPEDLADDSWRREESAEEEAQRRAEEEEEYRAAKAEADEEEAYARAEREGKQMERTVPPKAPKSRTALKTKLQEIFSIQEGSKGHVNEIADEIADRIQKGQDIPEEMTERLFDALYENGSYTQQADTYFREFRNTVKGSKIYVSPEVRAEFGEDWKALAAKARRAGLILTSDSGAGGVDVHAAELAQIYHTIDTEAHPAQQLEQIIDAADRGRPQTLSQEEMEDVLRGEYGEEAVQQRVEEMARAFRTALDVFRESAGTEVEIRAAADAKIRKAQQSAQALAKRQMEKKAFNELANKTLKQLQWLGKNRNRTDSQMRARFDDVLRNIDTLAVNTANELHVDKATGMTWRDLADLYKQAKESDPNFLPSKRLDDIVMRLDGEKIGNMDYSALQDLYKAAIGLRTEYYNRNNVINDEMGRTFDEAYHASRDEIKAAKGEAKGETKASRWFNREQLTPINYLRRLVGWKKDSTFASFGKQLESGERAYKKYIVDATKSLEGFLKKNADWVRRADGQGKDAIWYEYEVPELVELRMGDKPIYGDKVKVYMTPAQKVHLALECENYDNLRHMEGGRTFADKDLYSKGKRAEAFASGTTIKMSPEWAKKISSDLTPEEKALKDALSRYYNQYSKQEINRVSNALYGFDRAMSGAYAPIYTNKNYVGHKAGITDSTAEGVGSLKARQYSKNPSYNIGAFDAFERHADQMARFVGYAIPIRNMETLMNWRGSDISLRDEIDHKWKGANANDYIDKLLTDLQTTKYTERGAVEGLTSKLLSNYITAVFGANPGIVLKQAASFPQAGAILGFNTLPTPKQLMTVDRDLIGKYTPELNYRTLGYATPETAQLKNNPGLMQRNKALNFLFGGGAITAMDGATVQSIWPWAENYVSKNFPKLQKGTQEQIDAGESPYYRKVAEVFNEAVSTTQPMYDTMHRAKIMTRKDGSDRAFTMFKTVPLQQYNTLRQAFGEMQAAKQSGDAAERKAAARKTANAITATLGSVAALEGVELLNQLFKNGAKGYRDDDDELTAESIGKNVAERSVKDLAGMVIGGSELSDLIFNKINGKKWYGIEIPGGEQLNDIIDAFSSAAGAASDFVSSGADVLRNGGDLADYFRTHGAKYAGALKEAAEKLAMYVKGLPVQNVEKYLGGALRIAAPELYAQIGDLFDTPDRNALKKTGDAQLPTRIRDMLEQRIGNIPEESADELARLYQQYGSSMALPDTPKSIWVGEGDDAEDMKLSAYQQQVYERAFRSAVRVPLAGLSTDDEFQALDDDAKEAYIKRLYAVAGDWAKHSVDEDAGGTYSDKIMQLRRAGASMPTILTAFSMKAALSPAEFAAWVENDRFHGDALKAAKDVLDVKSEYDNLKAAGLEDREIFAVADAMDAIEGEKNKWKKLDALAGLDLPQKSIDQAASVYLSETEYAAYERSGMELGEFADAMARTKRIDSRAEGKKDADGETIDGTKKAEVIRGVDRLKIGEQEKIALLNAVGYKVAGYDRVKSFMSLTDYADALELQAMATGTKNAQGKTVDGSRQLEVMQGVNKMPLTAEEKSSLMLSLGDKVRGDNVAPPIWTTDYSGKDYEAYYYLSDSGRENYHKYCDWMAPSEYGKYADSISDFHTIYGKDGKEVASRKSQVIEYINALDLLPDQKTALYVAMGYNENMTDKGFRECPWWNALHLRSQYYPKK